MRPRWRRETPACSASPISIRGIFPRSAIRRRRSTSTMPGCRRHGRASTGWPSKRRGPPLPSGSTSLPGWLQRAVTPLKPMLRPLARKVGLSPSLDAQAEDILLAQIEDFKPDAGAQPGHLSRRPAADAAHQGDRQPDPDRTDRDCAVARRGLVRLRPDDVATVARRWISFAVSACARKSIIWRSSPAFSTRCRRRPPTTSMFPLSARCRRTTSSGLRCSRPSPNVTISNCSATRRRRCRPPPRCIAAFRAKSGAPRCIRRCGARRSRSTPTSTWPGGKPATCGCSRRPASARILLTDFKDNLHTLFAPDREVAVWRSVDDCLEAIDRALGDAESRAADRRSGPGQNHGAAYLSPSRGGDSGLCRADTGEADEHPAPCQASRQAFRQGNADPAPAHSAVGRLSRARRHRRSPSRPRIHRADGLPHERFRGRNAPIEGSSRP